MISAPYGRPRSVARSTLIWRGGIVIGGRLNLGRTSRCVLFLSDPRCRRFWLAHIAPSRSSCSSLLVQFPPWGGKARRRDGSGRCYNTGRERDVERCPSEW